MYFVVALDGRMYGPVDTATLRTWTQEGRITPQTQIQEQSGNRFPASSLQFLQDLLGPPPPQAPPAHSQQGQINQNGPAPFNQSISQSGTPFGSYGSQPGQGSGSAFGGGYSQSPYYRPGGVGVAYPGQRSKLAAALLAFFLGGLGIHRFYLGYTTIGIIQLVLCCTGISSIWALVDFVMILTGSLVDADGYVLI